jgi:hypothetical protein
MVLMTRSFGTVALVFAALTVPVATATSAAPASRNGDLSGPAGVARSVRVMADASDEWPITECGTVDGTGCAASSKRVDLARPTFSNPTDITNPMLPVSQLRSVVQLGTVEGKPFRSETTTLPEIGVVDWSGQRIPVVLSQYVAYLDGDIEEFALDRYAQADDGSVWYFGEDVIDYDGGSAVLTEGTWIAGRDGPPAMLMPAHPHFGDVFRVENVIGAVFEELTVKRVDQIVNGPNGRVPGAIVVDELGVTGGHSEKTLAPGYGEFLTRSDGEIEAMAVATPTNSIPGGVPVAIRKMLTAAWGTLEYARQQDWTSAAASVRLIRTQFDQARATPQPPRVVDSLRAASRALDAAVKRKNVAATEQRSIDVAQATIDLGARYLPPASTEVARFHLHTQQLRVDAAAHDAEGVTGEVAALEWVRDRIAGRLDPAGRVAVDNALRDLRTAADAKNLASAADHATRLASLLRNVSAKSAMFAA